MTMVSVEKKLGKKGQIHIPKIFVDQLGVKPGDKVFLTLQPNGILIAKNPGIDSVKNFLMNIATKREDQKIKVKLGDLKGVSLEDEFED